MADSEGSNPSTGTLTSLVSANPRSTTDSVTQNGDPRVNKGCRGRDSFAFVRRNVDNASASYPHRERAVLGSTTWGSKFDVSCGRAPPAGIARRIRSAHRRAPHARSTRCWWPGRTVAARRAVRRSRSRPATRDAMFKCLPIVVAVQLCRNLGVGRLRADLASRQRRRGAARRAGRRHRRRGHLPDRSARSRSRFPARSPCSPPSSRRCSWDSFGSRRGCSAGGARSTERPRRWPSRSSARASRGASIIREMLRSPTSRRSPVVVVDDDVRRHGSLVARRARGRRRRTLDQVVGASEPARSSSPIRAPTRRCCARRWRRPSGPRCRQGVPAGPRAADHGAVGARRPRPADRRPARPPAGRHRPRQHRLATIASRRVLITGAGGSIGSEIAAQVADVRPVTARPARPRRDPPPRGSPRACPPTVDPQLVLTDIRDRVRLQSVFERRATRGRVPRRRPQARAAARGRPGRGDQDQRAGARSNVLQVGRCRRRRTAGVHLVRQGGASEQRARSLEVHRRAARRRPRARRRPVVLGALRQRDRQPRQRHPDVRRADRRGWPGHGHRSPHDQVLHERVRGRDARPPGRRLRRRR